MCDALPVKRGIRLYANLNAIDFKCFLKEIFLTDVPERNKKNGAIW